MTNYVAIFCLLALAASTQADGDLGWGGPIYAPKHASVDYYAYPRYAFEYSVKDPHTGDNKAQWEKRDGDTVKGAYSLVEPDGSLRIVEYWADDKSGFNAVVKRIGPNLHPTGHAPIYKAPIPVLAGPVVGPLSIGPVAKLGGLAGAPLLGGGYGHGPAVSSQSLVKAAPIAYSAPIIKPILPIAPVYSAPLYKPAPVLPILKGPIGLGLGPIGYSGIGLGGGYKDIGLEGGLIKGPLIGDYKDIGLGGGLIKGPLIGGYNDLGLGGGLIKEPLIGGYKDIGLGGGLIKEPLIGGYNDLGLAGGWKGPVGLGGLGGPWDSSYGGWKH